MATEEEVTRALQVGHNNAAELMQIWAEAEDEEAQLAAVQERLGVTRLQAEVIGSMRPREFSKWARETIAIKVRQFDDGTAVGGLYDI